jgi:hypothetical protein
MQARIAREIKRSGLTTDIQAAIQTAIRAYETRPFYFNQGRATLNTVATVKIYGLPSDPTAAAGVFKKMRFLRLQRSGSSWQELLEYTRDEALNADTNDNLTGVPDHYFVEFLPKTTPDNDRATVGQLWLLPIPNDSFTLELHYFREMGPLSDNGDENVWTNEAEALIRCRAKRELYTHVIRDVGEAQKFTMAEQDALRDISRLNTMARAPGRLQANW